MKKTYFLSKFLVLFFPIALITSCNETSNEFDEQAHRGGRGLLPENTIISGKQAVDFENTLEIDLQMSKDGKVVVSHDAYFNSLFCLTPEGDTMTKKEGSKRLLFDMPYDSIAQYDCGSKPHPDFPQQENIAAVKPLLEELIDSVEAYADTKNHTLHYNMEIKSKEKYDGKHYPSLNEFVDSVMAVIERKDVASNTMIQSFDKRALQRVHEKWPDVEIAYLTWGKDKETAQEFIDELGFKPDVFSPNYNSSSAERVKSFHDEGIKVIPWTPNEVEEMQKLKDMGVDGMITDYPDKYAELE